MERTLENRKDPRTDTEAVEADSRTSLEQMISLLQGGQGAALADAGLTRLGAEQLDSLHRHASHQARLCRERANQLLWLMLYWMEDGEHPPDDLVASATQVATLAQERQRWMALAENARYYRQHPEVAAKISRSLGLCVAWPSAAACPAFCC